MKKLLILAAFAALVIPSCSQSPVDLGEQLPMAQIQKAPNASVAKKVVVKEGPAKEAGYMNIDLADSGVYCIEKALLKSDAEVQIITGTYTTADGVTYILTGFGTIKIDANGNITILKTGESELTGVTENVVKLPENDFTNAIAHSWTIDQVDIRVTAEGKTVNFTKQGCDLYAIATQIKSIVGTDMGSFDVEQFRGYNVTRLTVSSSRTFIIEFEGATTFKAEIPADVNILTTTSGYTFKYVGGSGNDIIGGEANCTFFPSSATTAQLTVQVKSNNITGYVTFYMTKADAVK